MVGCSPWGREELDTTERLHFHFSLSCTGEGMATHSSVLAWRIPGTGEPGGLPSTGSHRVGHDWSDLTAAAAENKYYVSCLSWPPMVLLSFNSSSIHISNSYLSTHLSIDCILFLLNCKKLLLALIFMSADTNRKEHQPMPEIRSSVKRQHLFYTMFLGI